MPSIDNILLYWRAYISTIQYSRRCNIFNAVVVAGPLLHDTPQHQHPHQQQDQLWSVLLSTDIGGEFRPTHHQLVRSSGREIFKFCCYTRRVAFRYSVGEEMGALSASRVLECYVLGMGTFFETLLKRYIQI